MIKFNKYMAINPDRIILIRETKDAKTFDIYYDLPSEGKPYTIFISELTLKETMERFNPKKSTRELLKEISDI